MAKNTFKSKAAVDYHADAGMARRTEVTITHLSGPAVTPVGRVEAEGGITVSQIGRGGESAIRVTNHGPLMVSAGGKRIAAESVEVRFADTTGISTIGHNPYAIGALQDPATQRSEAEGDGATSSE